MIAIDWLNSDKDYEKGLLLLQEAGTTEVIIKLLAKGKSYYNCRLMAKEVQKVADKNKPKPKPKFETENLVAPKADLSSSLIPPEIPQIKQALQEQYAIVNHFHPLMDAFYNVDRKKSFDVKISIQNAWKEIEELWRIVNYWKENKVLLPNKWTKDQAPQEELDKVGSMKSLYNLRSYISRHRNNPKKVLKLKQWKKELKDIELKIGSIDLYEK